MVRIGFVPLTDSAPLVVAQELGLFARHGVNVTLSREIGWASVREKILYQDLDFAHAPAPLLYRLRLGLDSAPCPVFAALFLNTGGTAITLQTESRRLGVRNAVDLRRVLRSRHPERPVFAVASLYSTHSFLLRRWLQSGGVDPDKDILIAVLPPEQMLESLKAGTIEGFAADEPWNSAAVAAGTGWCPATSATMAPAHPEKVLLAREEFTDQCPDESAAVLSAVHAACMWCEDPANRTVLTDLLNSARWFRDSPAAVRPALLGPFDCGDGNRTAPHELLRFYGPHLNEPTPDKGAWILSQMRAAGLTTVETPPEGALRPDLLAAALAGNGRTAP